VIPVQDHCDITATQLQPQCITTVKRYREEEISEDTLKMVFGDDYKEMLEDEGDGGLVHTAVTPL
jgi:hypothetical protein